MKNYIEDSLVLNEIKASTPPVQFVKEEGYACKNRKI